MEPNIKILIADENNEFRLQFISKLKAMGYSEISEAKNGEEALFKIGAEHPDIVFVDVWLSKLDCIQVMKGSKSLSYGADQRPSFVVLSIINHQNLFYEATEAGAEYCMLRPFDYKQLSERIKRVFSARSSRGGGASAEGGIYRRSLGHFVYARRGGDDTRSSERDHDGFHVVHGCRVPRFLHKSLLDENA